MGRGVQTLGRGLGVRKQNCVARMNNWGEKVSFIWSVADLLRGPYRPNQYKDVMLPLTVLRRLDCVLQPTKDRVLKRAEKLKGGKVTSIEPLLNRVTGLDFHNTSPFTFETLRDDPDDIAANLTQYIKGSQPGRSTSWNTFGLKNRSPSWRVPIGCF